MSGPSQPSGERVSTKADLVAYIAEGCKPKEGWLIGTEHEKFVFRTDDLRPLPYDGPVGIRAVLEGLQAYGWQPVKEDGNTIALSKNGASVTLEPGGQLELSGAPLATVHDTCREVDEHLRQCKAVGAKLGVGFIGLGFNPKWRREDFSWMPKGRYKIMRDYMPKRGSMGIDMMLRTCTVQVNLDFSSEADMVKKLRVSLALQPLATALWANSPFVEGKPTGFQSMRSQVWTDTDPDRCGTLPFAFEDGMGFERYVDYLLDVPMYFVYRDGKYIDASGQSFRAFLNGALPVLPGELPTASDWADHMTTAFPEVRLKKFLEMRGADGGPWRRLCALPAFWTGLLYHQSSLDAAWDLVKGWTIADHDRLRLDAPKMGLRAPVPGGTLQALAVTVLELSAAGLKARDKQDYLGRDETIFLDTVQEIARSGLTPADVMLAEYDGRWNRSVDSSFRDYSY